MAGLGDVLGKNGILTQLLMWNVLGQVISTLLGPALAQLGEDVNAHHPVQALDPAIAADLAARGIITVQAATAEAARTGVNASRFGELLDMHTVRLAPGDLATAVLRSYLTLPAAEKLAAPQGVTPWMLKVLVDLAGDAPGPQQLAEALRRGLVPKEGSGPASVSFRQGIAEGRLANKWADVIAELDTVLLSPADAASAVVRNFLSSSEGTHIAGLSGVLPGTFDTLVHLSGDAPGPQQLAEALRRGAIPLAGKGAAAISFEQGIAEGRLANKWAPVIQKLSQLWPTPVDALDAALKGQISDAEGKALYARLGGDLEFYPWLLASIGGSPTPLEAGILAARGIIAEHGIGPNVLSYDRTSCCCRTTWRPRWPPRISRRRITRPYPITAG